MEDIICGKNFEENELLSVPINKKNEFCFNEKTTYQSNTKFQFKKTSIPKFSWTEKTNDKLIIKIREKIRISRTTIMSKLSHNKITQVFVSFTTTKSKP